LCWVNLERFIYVKLQLIKSAIQFEFLESAIQFQFLQPAFKFKFLESSFFEFQFVGSSLYSHRTSPEWNVRLPAL
jgi:hypothetical protein